MCLLKKGVIQFIRLQGSFCFGNGEFFWAVILIGCAVALRFIANSIFCFRGVSEIKANVFGFCVGAIEHNFAE